MNIMILTTSLCGGGAERVSARLASELSRNHNVWIVCTYPDGNWKGTYDLDPRVKQIDLDPPPPFKGKITARWLLYPVRARQRKLMIRDLKTEIRADVCISFLAEPNFDNVRSAQGEKTIISVRNIYKLPIRKFWFWQLMDRFLMVTAGRRADRVVTVSNNVGVEQIKRYHVQKRKIRTIYNPVDPDAIRRASEAPTGHDAFDAFRAAHDVLFLSAGRFVEQKGFHHLIRAFREVSQQCPGAGLVLMGEGHLQDSLERVIRANGLENHVLLPGFHKDPFPFFGKCDVFVMSSFYEGFSNAMLEAMACGLPVILTDCNSGPREMCAPDTDSTLQTQTVDYALWGILTPVCSGHMALTDEPPEPEEKCLADAMCRLASDSSLREDYARRSLTRANDFSTDRIMEQWESLLLELCGPQQADRPSGGAC